MRQYAIITALTFLLFAIALEIFLHYLLSPEAAAGKVSFVQNRSSFIITNPNFEFDSVRGYRFTNTANTRYAYFAGNNREIDFVMHVNNVGYTSKIDYVPQKPIATKRYLVFGDSFSAGVLMDTTWVDHVNFFLQRNSMPIELYNFSVDGGGMANWYSIYKREIDSVYDFDGVILAVYMDDLNRFFVGWWRDSSLLKGDYFPSQKDFARRNEMGMEIFDNYTDSAFSDYEKQYFEVDASRTYPFFMIPAFLNGELQWGDPYERGQKKYYSQYIDKGDFLPFEKLNQRYNAENMLLLDSMAVQLKSKGKELHIIIIPDKYVIRGKKKNASFTALYETDLKLIAEHYNASLFNGNNAFTQYSLPALDSMWLHGDLHWNKDGAREFAKHYFHFLSESKTKREKYVITKIDN